MAKRPVYMVATTGTLINREIIEFEFCSGFSIQQKQKSIHNIHESFHKLHQASNILEVSSKSTEELGVRLSAFNLKINLGNNHFCSVENAFQSAKVFENGGPYEDIIYKTPLEAKKDPRLKESGYLVGFSFRSKQYPIFPQTLFYNWLYIHALYQKQNTDLMNQIVKYDAFTDIEFNPQKSINCQAEACAFAVALYRKGKFPAVLLSLDKFRNELYGYSRDDEQPSLEKFFGI